MPTAAPMSRVGSVGGGTGSTSWPCGGCRAGGGGREASRAADNGIAHRNPDARRPDVDVADAVLAVAVVNRALGFAAGPRVETPMGRPPLVADRRSWPSVLTWRSPSRSVRSTRAPCARRRATVSGAGCPYGLPVPALIMATRGWSALSQASEVAVRLPWWATFSTSTRLAGPPMPLPSRVGSTSSSMSPVSSIRRSP
jgi:hypothetical protein